MGSVGYNISVALNVWTFSVSKLCNRPYALIKLPQGFITTSGPGSGLGQGRLGLRHPNRQIYDLGTQAQAPRLRHPATSIPGISDPSCVRPGELDPDPAWARPVPQNVQVFAPPLHLQRSLHVSRQRKHSALHCFTQKYLIIVPRYA